MTGANRARPWPTTTTRLAGIIGHPVAHSLSPVLHNAAFHALGLDWAYMAFDVPQGGGRAAVEAFRALRLGGLSVTMPLKEEVARAVDLLTAAAEAVGSVNTVSWQGDEVVGDCTDGPGFIDALLDEGFDPQGRSCVVVGAGGAARSVVHALAGSGAARVAVVNRDRDRADRAAALAGSAGEVAGGEAIAAADLIVNATPVGMDGRAVPVDVSLLREGQLVCDLVYSPPVTPLLRAARQSGATAMNGMSMLIHQAARQVVVWTGQQPPLAVMSAAAVSSVSGGH